MIPLWIGEANQELLTSCLPNLYEKRTELLLLLMACLARLAILSPFHDRVDILELASHYLVTVDILCGAGG